MFSTELCKVIKTFLNIPSIKFGEEYAFEKFGKYYRSDGPAVIQFLRVNMSIIMKTWCENGDLHRTDGPANIWYYENGNIKIEEYYKNGERHRIGGPAFIRYIEDGTICQRMYYQNDKKIFYP